MNDNFPNLACKQENVSLTYNGNKYSTFFHYPKKASDDYNECLGYVKDVLIITSNS